MRKWGGQVCFPQSYINPFMQFPISTSPHIIIFYYFKTQNIIKLNIYEEGKGLVGDSKHKISYDNKCIFPSLTRVKPAPSAAFLQATASFFEVTGRSSISNCG